jgi:hypothetical protein
MFQPRGVYTSEMTSFSPWKFQTLSAYDIATFLLIVGTQLGFRVRTRSCKRSASLADARAVIDPVDLPGLAAVLRKRLLKVRLVVAHRLPRVADDHSASLPRVCAVEFAVSVAQLTDHWWIKLLRPAINETDRPELFW